MNTGHRLRPPFRYEKGGPFIYSWHKGCVSSGLVKIDSGLNLRKIKIFGIIYIESDGKLTNYIIFRRNPNG